MPQPPRAQTADASLQDLHEWPEFLENLEALKNSDTELLFRGESDSSWSLQTTLERRNGNLSVSDYYRMVAQRVRPQIESLTGFAWEVPSYPEMEPKFKDYDSFSLLLDGPGFPAYSYLIYARHHGFPSPLLDWTRSPYVAAYFAFVSPKKVERRSIYVWSEPPPEKRVAYGTDTQEVHRLGPYIRAHRRHVLQQNDYTVGLMCLTHGTKNHQWRFISQVESLSRNAQNEVCLRKFTLPSTERLKILRFLEGANITGFSLFGSEESLMDTLAIREFDLRLSPPTPTPTTKP